MQNKRKLAFIPLVALLGLAGCDIQAKPDNYEKVIVTFDDDEAKSKNVYNNISSIVEDAYHDGALASDVLEEVLYQYSVSIFGRYNKIVPGNTKDPAVEETTLKEAVNNAKNGDKTIAKAFIDTHKSYWTVDKDGNRVETEEGKASEITRLIERWDIIEQLIAEKMYNAISGGSYSDRGIFSEAKFVESLKNSGKKVNTEGTNYTGLLLPSVEPEEVFTKNVLNRAHFQENFGLSEVENANTKVKYIEDEIIPDLYNSLLVSQYLVDKKYNVLGSSYARKVNIFSISAKTDFPKQDDYLMDSLISKINAIPADGSDERFNIDIDTFKAYSNAWNGIFNGQPTISILDDINAKDSSLFKKELEPISGDPYYVGTEYGEMVKDYHKLDDLTDPEKYRTVDSSIKSDFTNNGAYVKEIGRQIKENDIAVKDNTQTGWYISNGGLSSLPESIRSRLFSFSVATAFKEEARVQDLQDRLQKDENKHWTYEVPEDESSYLARINNVYYLKNSSASQGSDPRKDILFYDTSSSTYYVIQVLEAVRSAKIDKNPSTEPGEIVTYDAAKKEEVVNAICKCVAGTESYTTLAKKYWLEEMSIQYHDTVVYDYFKANYPELFEDD